MGDEEKNNSNESVEDQPAVETTSPDAESLATELASLREQLVAKELEAKDNYDRYVRLVAETENFKKRSVRERDDAIRYANESLLKELLPVIDNLERAIAHAAAVGGDNGKNLVEGVEMVLKGLLDVLSKIGVTQISALGQPFDPSKHEAMAQVESDAHAPNTVVQELHKGYQFRDRLLRAALVSVAKAPEMKGKKNDDRQVENDQSDD
jgi:molecular chaperone GrpE